MKKASKISVLSIIVFICSIFWLMPLLLIFINSFKPYNDMLQEFLALPKSWSLNMYIETWTKFDFPLLIGNTLLYTICTVLIIALLAAYGGLQTGKNKRKTVRCLLCPDHYPDDGALPVLHDHPDKTGGEHGNDRK